MLGKKKEKKKRWSVSVSHHLARNTYVASGEYVTTIRRIPIVLCRVYNIGPNI